MRPHVLLSFIFLSCSDKNNAVPLDAEMRDFLKGNWIAIIDETNPHPDPTLNPWLYAYRRTFLSFENAALIYEDSSISLSLLDGAIDTTWWSATGELPIEAYNPIESICSEGIYKYLLSNDVSFVGRLKLHDITYDYFLSNTWENPPQAYGLEPIPGLPGYAPCLFTNLTQDSINFNNTQWGKYFTRME
ncbi:MAG: hypothetical protein ACI8QD_001974 [Cyclobacteriaceae bacterium]|jgi:hypothetical protein